MMSPSIGLALATHSEGALLDTCLRSAAGFDEVIVFDLESTDDSVSVATRHGARVVGAPSVAFVELIRERQLAAASTEWVFFMDPDEVLPMGWLDAVRRRISQASPSIAGYWIEYQDVAFGHRLEYTRQGAAKVALVRRSAASSRLTTQVRPHDMLILSGETSSLVGELPRIEHHSYRTIHESIDKLARYAINGGVGADLADSSITPLTCIKMLWGSVVMTRSWRDGTPGVAVASLSAIGDYLGLLQRWDGEGRPPMAMSRRQTSALESLRKAHKAQWRARMSVRARARSRET